MISVTNNQDGLKGNEKYFELIFGFGDWEQTGNGLISKIQE